MTNSIHTHTIAQKHGTVSSLIELLAFPWIASERAGKKGWIAINATAERSFWKQPDGKWLILWRDGNQPTRIMALEGNLTPNEIATKITRWHLNRSAMLRNDGQPIPDNARGWVNLLMEHTPGILAQRCSAVLRRPIPVDWTLADAINAFPNEQNT